MKYFIVNITCYDGEHEHLYEYVARGRSKDTVNRRLKREQCYEYGQRALNAMTSFGDGETGASAYVDREIPKEHFDFLVTNKYMQQV